MKKCIKCNKEIECSAEYCGYCGALQWSLASVTKKWVKAQQILINILAVVIIVIQLYVAAVYKNYVSSSNGVSIGLITSSAIMLVALVAYNIKFSWILLVGFDLNYKKINK